MNRIISANINGFIFQIDEVAYESLKSYLDSIRQKVNNIEVASDIENRIAELFDYKLRNGSQAIFKQDVEEIISQIGSPEQLGSEEQQENKDSMPPPAEPRRKGYRRLYRNDDDKVVGGVCSGIAAYFDIDPIIPRLIFGAAFFFVGTGFLLYIFLVIVLPKAITPAEKLEMRGETVDYKNLSKTFEKDIKDAYEKYKPGVKQGVSRFSEVFVKIVMIVLMVFLVSIFLPGCVAVLASIGVASWSLPVLGSYMFTSEAESYIILVGLILFLTIPLIGLGHKLMRIIFKTKPMNGILTTALTLLWCTGFALLAYSAFNIGTKFSSYSKITQIDTLDMGKGTQRSLIIKASRGDGQTEFIIEKDTQGRHMQISSRKDMRDFLDEEISKNIDLNIVSGYGSQPLITVSRRSAGTSNNDAAMNAERMEYHYSFKDSVLILDNFFSLGENQLWRNQKVYITVEVPESYNLYIDRSCDRMMEYTHYRSHRHNNGITGKHLKVGSNGIIIPVD